MSHIDDPEYYWVDIHPDRENNRLFMCGMCRRVSEPKSGWDFCPYCGKRKVGTIDIHQIPDPLIRKEV